MKFIVLTLLITCVLLSLVNAGNVKEINENSGMINYRLMESKKFIEKRGCTDLCCNGKASCCTVNGGIYRAKTCSCCFDDNCQGTCNDPTQKCCSKKLSIPTSAGGFVFSWAKMLACLASPHNFGC
jgi:hypothetical protein